MLLWIHPIVQGLVAVLALYVLWLGLKRFASRHLNMAADFPWKRHVTLGKVVVAVWALGGLGGLAMTYLSFGRIFPESFHFRNAVAILVLLAVTWFTGTRMDRRRGQSNALPLIHAANNVILLILAALQAASGIGIVQSALLK
jgi:hypothetical protein